MKTGALIKDLRIKKGITQEELAIKTEVSTRTIQRIENCEVDPRAYTLQMIAQALDVGYELFVEQNTTNNNEVKKENSNIWFVFLYLSGIIPVLFPTILIWNRKKNNVDGITHHFRTVISIQLLIIGICLGCLWVYYKVNIITPFIGILLANGLFAVMNAFRIFSGASAIELPFVKSKN